MYCTIANQTYRPELVSSFIIPSHLPIAVLSSPTFVQHLNDAAQTYFNLDISSSTRKAYAVGLQKYMTFCI